MSDSWLDEVDHKWSLYQCPRCMRSFRVEGATRRIRIKTMDDRVKAGWVCVECDISIRMEEGRPTQPALERWRDLHR